VRGPNQEGKAWKEGDIEAGREVKSTQNRVETEAPGTPSI
jgi:hypothetical protein